MEDGSYKMMSQKNREDKKEETHNKQKLLKKISKIKMLKFASDFLEKRQK